MIIKPICPKCNHRLTINIKKIDRQAKYILELEKENRELKATLRLQYKKKDDFNINDFFNNIIK